MVIFVIHTKGGFADVINFTRSRGIFFELFLISRKLLVGIGPLTIGVLLEGLMLSTTKIPL